MKLMQLSMVYLNRGEVDDGGRGSLRQQSSAKGHQVGWIERTGNDLQPCALWTTRGCHTLHLARDLMSQT
jgi:hypothetical protein